MYNIPLQESQEAEDKFRSVMTGNNFMAPHVLGYYQMGECAAELAWGRGFRPDGEMFYGVTVVKNGRHDKDLSATFESGNAACDYIETLVIA